VNGLADNSGDVTFNKAGNFWWQATYSGDVNNVGTSSACTSEPLVVNPKHPTLDTVLVPASPVTVGATVHDTSTLTGATGDAGGTISYAVYTDNACTKLATVANDGISGQPTGGNVTNGLADNSGDVTFSKAGNFWWQATYSGDVNNVGTKSDCTSEPLVVNPKHPTLATILVPPSPVTVGATVHDTAQLTGATGDAGGTISYAVYTDNTCSTLATVATDGISGQPTGGNVTNGIADNSGDVTFNKAGNFWWQATYSGDVNNVGTTSPCTSEPLVVNPKHPTLATILVPASPVTVGATVHDTAQLTGATANAGGTISYAVYTDNTCSTLATVATDGISGQPTGGNVTNGIADNSGDVTFNKAGNFWWQATYSGDVNNVGTKSDCTSEPLVVNPKHPTLATILVPASPVTVGTTVHDTAQLTGATSNAGGTITYAVYTDNTCSTLATVANDGISGQPTGGNVTNGIADNSGNVTFNKAGNFWWQATYSGDVNNVGTSSACTSEPLVVNPKHPTLATILVPSGTINAGQSASDTAQLTGATANAGGTISYAVYTDSSCTTLATAPAISGQPTGGAVTNGSPASSSSVTFNTPGTYYWQATYSGDVNNVGTKSPCGSEVLVVINPFQGCTPGFWKNHTGVWDQLSDPTVTAMPTGLKFTTSTLFNTYFGLTAKQSPFNDKVTMLQAVSAGGGGGMKLARMGISALLNVAAGLKYQFPPGATDFTSLYNVIQQAFLSKNYEPLATQLDTANNNEATANCSGIK
jgi:hypothetical protein